MTIEFCNVHASYDASTPILRGVDFTVNDGDFVAFVGTNGAGKSTTMRLMNGLLKPDEGEVLIDGVPTTQLKTSELARRVGFLFQNPDSQICCGTVREELLFGFRALGANMDEAARRVDAVIDEFGFNGQDDPFLLNRGTRQLLALASIVVLGTPIVVLDEPTTGLDFRECVKVMNVIRRLHEQGTTVVMVCHDMEVVGDFAERVIVMSDGRVVDDGPTFEVLRNRHTLAQASLVPPQIVDISLALPLMAPTTAGTPIATANVLSEMEAAVLSFATRLKRAASSAADGVREHSAIRRGSPAFVPAAVDVDAHSSTGSDAYSPASSSADARSIASGGIDACSPASEFTPAAMLAADAAPISTSHASSMEGGSR